MADYQKTLPPGDNKKPPREKHPSEVVIRAIWDKETGAVTLFFKPCALEDVEFSKVTGRAKKIAGTAGWANIPGLPVGYFLTLALVYAPEFSERIKNKKLFNKAKHKEGKRLAYEQRQKDMKNTEWWYDPKNNRV